MPVADMNPRSMGEPRHIFVYGTLMRASGHPMHRLLARGATYVGKGSIPGRLFDLGEFPGILLDTASEDRVHGEIHQVTEGREVELLASLDRYEGVPATSGPRALYRRVSTDARTEGGEMVRVWVYELLDRDPRFVPIAGGDYLSYRAGRTT